VKIADWNATIQLFREEYKVPVLPPEIAAHMAAAMELGLSSLVLVGLFSRLSVLDCWAWWLSSSSSSNRWAGPITSSGWAS